MYRVGNSIDIHKFCEGRELKLGGIEIDYKFGLKGHSDADVLLHSVCEAIIGALGLGDIGTHYPDTDEKYSGIDSQLLLSHTVSMMESKSYEINNVDVTVLCEEPHLKEYKDKIRNNLARLLKTDECNVNIKATRGEKMGFIGRAEGIVSICTLLLRRKEDE